MYYVNSLIIPSWGLTPGVSLVGWLGASTLYEARWTLPNDRTTVTLGNTHTFQGFLVKITQNSLLVE